MPEDEVMSARQKQESLVTFSTAGSMLADIQPFVLSLAMRTEYTWSII